LVAIIFSLSQANAGVSETIEAYYPKDVGALFLRGSACGLNWNSGFEMKREAQNDGSFKWSYTVECDSNVSTPLEVKVLVNDDHWMLGANAFIDLSPSKTDTNKIYPWFYTYQGTLNIIKNVHSSELDNFRDVIFYMPPSYYENTLKVHKNILIMHDGQNLFNPATSAYGAWMCQDTLDETIIGGSTDEVMIVGPYNTVDRNDEYTYVYDASEGCGGKGDLYLDWIESTLIPLVRDSYRVQIDRSTLGIMGSSLGGLISCYAGWTRSTVYGKVGCMSSSFWWDDVDFIKNIMVNNNPSSSVPVPQIYMDSGTKESKSCTVYTTTFYDYCLTDGFAANSTVFQYLDQGGEHSESSWGPRFHIPMEDLYPVTTVN
jgi:predicted alpha/beta superfamily hydrolase